MITHTCIGNAQSTKHTRPHVKRMFYFKYLWSFCLYSNVMRQSPTSIQLSHHVRLILSPSPLFTVRSLVCPNVRSDCHSLAQIQRKKLCQVEGCDKGAQTGGRCIAHGGGRRCQVEGCNKGAQSGGRCRAHVGVAMSSKRL